MANTLHQNRKYGTSKRNNVSNQSQRLRTSPLKCCTLNICGYSEKCRMALNNFVHKEKIHILAVQETGEYNIDKYELHNMNFISDTNGGSNRGAALYVNNNLSITKIDSISKTSKHLDSCWGLVVAFNKKFIVGSIYINHNHKPAIAETMNMLKEAESKKNELKASGIILMGDFNARHYAWGDKCITPNGKSLSESLNNCLYSICTSNTPTFLCSNNGVEGSSYIDLVIVSNNLTELISNFHTDEEEELWTGSPLRGHVPLMFEVSINIHHEMTPVVEKLDLTKMKWEEWNNHIENSVNEIEHHIANEEDPVVLWNSLNKFIQEATDKYGTTKKCCRHSKPFWSEKLTILSNELRAARKSYIKRNTHINFAKLTKAKTAFEEESKLACQNFLINTAKQLNSAQSIKFWKDFNKIFKKKSVNKIDPLFDAEENLQTEVEEIEQCLFSTFFEAKHLSEGNFDEMFLTEVENIYNRILSEEPSEFNEDDLYNLNQDITISELQKAMKSTGKSFDNLNFHPTMFKHLGPKALMLLVEIFNACLKKHIWIWEMAEVIFLRKPGKKSYSKAGSYRPICITSYVGKLFEAILTRRIELYLLITEQTDPNQEGFSASKNTIRYLNRLHLGIEADKEKNLSILCLFIDFEKAFDSVWKKGLLVKLYNLGIKGHIAHLINSFLFTRKVKINVNGQIGDTRQCADYGLPQGSVLSPVLFKIFVHDLLEEINNCPDISIYKFADDGTVKISATNSQICIQTLDRVLGCLHSWTRKWRMKVNTDRNKTEVICFHTSENDKSLIPQSFLLGNKEIFKVTETKVLGLLIDENLTYQSHSKLVLRSLHERWASLCKYSNRYWGFHQSVMVYLLHALFISKLSYAGHIWMTKENLREISQLWYHILKSVTGAVLNIAQNIAELLLGIPPIQIQTQTNRIKHFLKIINKPVQHDKFREFLNLTYDGEKKTPNSIHIKYKEVFNFLQWKLTQHPLHFNELDTIIIQESQHNNFLHLSEKSCSYTQKMMKKYTESVLWASSIKNQFQLNGYPKAPNPSCSPIQMPSGTSRKREVQLMALCYKNNLLNQSLYSIGRKASPLCRYCSVEEETSHHLLFYCGFVDENLRQSAHRKYRLAIKLQEEEPEPDSFIGLLDAIKNCEFVKACIDIIDVLDFDVTIIL